MAAVLRVVNGQEQTVGHVNPEIAQYFIAGAFGMAELSNPFPLDQIIVEGLMTLYQSCLRDKNACRSDATWQTVAARWNGIARDRAALEQARQEAVRLQQEYDGIAQQVNHQSDLLAKVAAFRQAILQNPRTFDDHQQNTRNLQSMIRIARAQLEEEQQATTEEQHRVQIASWRAALQGMHDRINEEEGAWYYRFTEAFDAGMACMPQPRTPEEEYCVVGNTYRMGMILEQRAREHPAGSECIRSETEWTESTAYRCYGTGDERSCDWEEVSRPRSVCIESRPVGRDTSADEALNIARSYCTTTCRE